MVQAEHSIWQHQWWLSFFVDVGVDWVMQLLLILLVVVCAIFIERLIYLAVRYGKPDALETLIKSKSYQSIDSLVETDTTKFSKWSLPLANAKQLFNHLSSHATPSGAHEVLQGNLRTERLNLERGLAFLGTIGNNAPFLGLFGTVLGIIKAFRDLSTNVTSGSAAVMAGLAEALVATAIGLMVALPAVVAFNLLQRQVNSILQRSEAIGEHIIASFPLPPAPSPETESEQDTDGA